MTLEKVTCADRLRRSEVGRSEDHIFVPDIIGL